MRSTTILVLRHRGSVGDGGRRPGHLGQHGHEAQGPQGAAPATAASVLAGFAGATADAFTLFDKFEKQLEQYNGNLTPPAVELAKDWRTDRVLRRLEALLLAADRDALLLLSGNGRCHRTGRTGDRHRLRRQLRPGRGKAPSNRCAQRPRTASPDSRAGHAHCGLASACTRTMNRPWRSCT